MEKGRRGEGRGSMSGREKGRDETRLMSKGQREGREKRRWGDTGVGDMETG